MDDAALQLRVNQNTCLPSDSNSLNPFVKSLFEMDDRIRCDNSLGDIIEYRFYIIRKHFMVIPYNFPDERHEVAHMVEMRDSSRLVKDDWGMPIRTGGNKLEKYSHAGFFTALSREIRVRAIQHHMMDYGSKEAEHRSTTYNIFNNSSWLQETLRRMPYGRFNTQKDAQDWARHLHDTTYSHWGLDRIRETWIKRLDVIRDWMETR